MNNMEKWVAYSLFAPIIVDPRWTDLPEELVKKATLHRMAKVASGDFSEKATDYEAMVYLHTVSLAQPLGETMRSIYFWLFRKFYPAQADTIGLPNPNLTEIEHRELEKLKEWIFRMQMKAIKQRVKA